AHPTVRRPLWLQNQTRRTLGWWSRWSVVWGLRLGCGDDGTWRGGGGGFGGDGDEVVRMARAVVVSWVAAAVAVSGWWWRSRRVEARELVDRVDRGMRNNFGFGRKTRRKSFPAAAWCRWPEFGGGCEVEREEEDDACVCVIFL
ncbi:hypothetical protein Tco_0279313, partial [Tanacetum coccineum]